MPRIQKGKWGGPHPGHAWRLLASGVSGEMEQERGRRCPGVRVQLPSQLPGPPLVEPGETWGGLGPAVRVGSGSASLLRVRCPPGPAPRAAQSSGPGGGGRPDVHPGSGLGCGTDPGQARLPRAALPCAVATRAGAHAAQSGPALSSDLTRQPCALGAAHRAPTQLGVPRACVLPAVGGCWPRAPACAAWLLCTRWVLGSFRAAPAALRWALPCPRGQTGS